MSPPRSRSRRAGSAAPRDGALFERAPVALYRMTRDGALLEVNPAMAALAGYASAAELLAAGAGDLLADPAAWPRLRAQLAQAGQVQDAALGWRRRDGAIVPVSIRIWEIRGAHGELLGYEGAAARPGEAVAASETPTHRERLADALARARPGPPEPPGALLSRVAHDLRGPLTVILQFATILQDGIMGELNAEQRDCADAVVQHARQLRAMIHDLFDEPRSPAEGGVDGQAEDPHCR